MNHSLIDKDNLNDILAHYPSDVHDLLIRQLSVVEGLYAADPERFANDYGFRVGIELMLRNIIDGKFLPFGVKKLE